MFRIFVIFFLLLIEFPLQSNFNWGNENQKIINQFLKEIKTLKIYAIGIGGGQRGEINDISLHLECQQQLNLEEARDLYLGLLYNILNKYNYNEKIRPHLHNYPFTYHNIDLMVSFNENDCQRVSKEHIALMFMVHRRNKIFYESYDKKADKFITVHSEEIAETLSKYCKNLLNK